jgi:L-lactate dehydrogenase complex protein LldF
LSLEAIIWFGWLQIHQHPKLYRLATSAAAYFRALKIKTPKNWTKTRTMPKPAKQSLHQRMQAKSKSRDIV